MLRTGQRLKSVFTFVLKDSLVAVMCLAISNRSVRLMVMMREEMMRIVGNEIEMSGSQRYRLLNSRWKFAHFCS